MDFEKILSNLNSAALKFQRGIKIQMTLYVYRYSLLTLDSVNLKSTAKRQYVLCLILVDSTFSLGRAALQPYGCKLYRYDMQWYE